jgi:hypothetical protein
MIALRAIPATPSAARTVLLTALALLSPLAASAQEDVPARHWSLQPIGSPAVPGFERAADRQWARNPVDAFILARLRRAGLAPAPLAERRTLIRRLSFDLTGLPPTPEEVEAFVGDVQPDAYERLVERLLASPRYGERWGRHWLDVVRYAETEGFEYDRLRRGAWRFRDYVIRSFNADKPYDRFVTEQIAGDEIEADNPEMLIAAGFHRLGPVRRNAGNPELVFSRHEALTEMTDALGVVFLGLSVGCARCHDHKFDEFSQADYYRLQAFLAATQERDALLADDAAQARWKALDDRVRRQLVALQKALPRLEGSTRARAERTLRALQERLPVPLPAISSVAHVEARRTPIHVLKRGDSEKKGPLVGPGLPALFTGRSAVTLPAASPAPRTALARAIACADNPLAARVLVNRVWQHHFARGMVETANDFGVNGSAPSHPELLDFLARVLIEGGWRIKPLQRLIVRSSTYRQASLGLDQRAGAARDGDNRLLWRFPRRRLSAEEVVDAMLLISARLNGKMGGPSVVPPADADLVKLLYAPSQWRVTPDRGEHDRRAIYLIARRNLRLPLLDAFDQPDAQTSCAGRASSTHALQALEMLNGKRANDLARSLAQRLRRECGSDPERRVERAFVLAAGGAPTAREKDLAVRFLHHGPLEELALAVFNLNAFLYVE